MPVMAGAEFLCLALCLIPRQAIALLELAGELLTLAFELCQVVVCQLAPLLLHFAFDLMPGTRRTVVVHDRSSNEGIFVLRRSNGCANPCGGVSSARSRQFARGLF